MTQPIEINLDAIAHGGEAIGRHAGKAVFVPYAIPVSACESRSSRRRNVWARARLLDVLERSPDRVAPPCPYFGPAADRAAAASGSTSPTSARPS